MVGRCQARDAAASAAGAVVAAAKSGNSAHKVQVSGSSSELPSSTSNRWPVEVRLAVSQVRGEERSGSGCASLAREARSSSGAKNFQFSFLARDKVKKQVNEEGEQTFHFSEATAREEERKGKNKMNFYLRSYLNAQQTISSPELEAGMKSKFKLQQHYHQLYHHLKQNNNNNNNNLPPYHHQVGDIPGAAINLTQLITCRSPGPAAQSCASGQCVEQRRRAAKSMQSNEKKSTSPAPQLLSHCDRSMATSSSPASQQSSWSDRASGHQALGDLVAIGATSLQAAATDLAPGTDSNRQLRFSSSSSAAAEQRANKLEYIIDFMRANKLTKFCDLLTNSSPEIRRLSERLNALEQFTLFVPTNEALLLMPPGHLERIAERPDELKQFLLSHATSELVVPTLGPAQNNAQTNSLITANNNNNNNINNNINNQGTIIRQQQSNTNLVFSLAGSPLRITTLATAPNLNSPPNQTNINSSSSSASAATKLELIVNGASVLAGHSYALQEPGNVSATYAIVHLLDRSLYPPPNVSLMQRARTLAPIMARYLDLDASSFGGSSSGDLDVSRSTIPLRDSLDSSRNLLTLFLPNDDAFRAAPAKLLNQLDTNATYRRHFLHSHLIDGLYFSGQLAALQDPSTGSLAGTRLEFESKTLQSRTLILVNSIPVLEPDLMALNGVAHLIARPIFERHLLEACHCGGTSGTQTSRTSGSQGNFTEAATYERSWPKPALTGGDESASSNTSATWQATNELERDESQVQQQRSRSQRSGIVARNNQDFYRPTAAPVVAPTVSRGGISGANSGSNSQLQLQQPQLLDQANGLVTELFDVDRYKVVLNATSRQRQREQLLSGRPDTQASPSSSGGNSLFAYDRPLTGRPFSAPASGSASQQLAPSLNSSGWTSSEPLSGLASSQGRQHVIKFQPEDARDTGRQVQPPAGARLFNNGSANAMGQAASNVQPAYDIVTSASQGRHSNENMKLQLQQQGAGKTAPPPIQSGIGACAFYDAECRRLVGRLVRLPAIQRNKSARPSSKLVSSASNQTFSERPFVGSTSEQHLDSTFGETTESPAAGGQLSGRPQPPPPARQASASFGRPQQGLALGPPGVRVSPLNQPLPPWSEEELHTARPGGATGAASGGGQGFLVSSWRTQDGDIARIAAQAAKVSADSSGGSKKQMFSSQQQQTNSNQAQIVLVPMRVLQETVLPSLVAQLGGNAANITLPPSPSSQRSGVIFGSGQQYHTPTPYSVNLATTHMPSIFNTPNRATNLSVLDDGFYLASDEVNKQRGSSLGDLVSPNFGNSPNSALRAPVAHRRQRLQQIQMENNGSFGANFELNPTNGAKQARKIVRLHTAQPSSLGASEKGFVPTASSDIGQSTGDIQVTSARLNLSPAGLVMNSSHFSEGLASHASDQAPNVSSARLSDQQQSDFFQNRTIAEIMDDSGLRIDGQQVTFNRLKQCLVEADLLSLITQTGNALTIFMPTDTAFQRLVQQQALAQQRERQSGQSLSSGRLLAGESTPARRYLLPLAVRRAPTSSDGNNLSGRLRLASGDTSEPLLGPSDFSAINAADRLTLDCSTNQVRQLLLDHLSARLITPKQLQTDMALSSLSGKQLLLSSVPSKKIVVVDGQPVIAATRAKNGMVYVVNKFLNLTQQVPNVIQLVETQPNLTTFLSYLSFSSLADRLKRETGPLTILAPTNEAFEQLSSSARQLINSDPAALMDVLRGHIVEGAQFGKLISMRSRLKTMNADQTIEARVIKPNVYLLDNQMTSMRLVGTTGNGVVNAIDRLIVPSWLKVSMGAKPANSGSSSTNTDGGGFSRSGNQFSSPGELDAALARQSLNSSPIRFGQPAGSGPSVGIESGNSLDRNHLFDNSLTSDIPQPPSSSSLPLNSDFGTSRSAFQRNPFSALNGSSEATQRPPLSTGNSSKNMRLIEKLADLMKARKFVKYLQKSNLGASLKPDMNYVLLVPTDQALDKLPRQIVDLLERDPERLADLVNYHVLDTTFEYINTIPDGQTLSTLNEKDILFNWHRNNTILTASGAVVMGGVQEENIALLVVDRVLYPTPGDLLSIVSKSPILSNFTALVRNAGLEQQLSLAGPYTLFAPSDLAFNQLASTELEFLQRNRESARRFLLRHLSQPAVFTSSIALSNTSQALSNGITGQQVPTMSISNSLGEELTLRQRNDYFSVNEVNISYADVAATNGVVHVIDGLL